MPFTPYHFGPGILLKSSDPESVSLSSFVATNIVIDSEVLVNLATDRYPIHGIFHTLPVAIAVGIGVGLVFYGVGQYFERLWGGEFFGRSALLGGMLGGLLQPLLDAVIHYDVQPFYPLSSANPFFNLLGIRVLNTACIVTAFVGIVIMLYRYGRLKKT